MYRRTTDYEYVERTPEGRFLTGALEEVPPKFVEEACDRCEETEGPLADDMLAQFWDPESQTAKVMHGQCGVDEGLELA
jgi:hypothetical protein